MAKEILTNGAVIASGAASENYVQQIAAGNTNFDIAVKNGIRFFNGQNDENGILWDGVSPMEVVIPTLADIVTDPVRLVGTINASGEGAPSTPKNGDLVYITADCTFASQACEAGDMAVYYNNDWHVISGENQITIVGGETDKSGNHTVAISGTAVKVLDVEGKGLSLAIDYGDIREEMAFSTNPSTTLTVSNGQVTVAPMYVALSQTAGTSEDISTSVSIDLPTALANGAVTIDSVLRASDFTFTSGSFPTISKNAEAITVNASHSMTIAKSNTTGDFVTDVTAIKAISFDVGTSAFNDFSYVTGLSSIAGTSFVSGVHTYDSTKDEGKTADFSIWGQATVSNSTFVSGLSEDSTSGDLVSAITVGAVTLGEGSGILTGLSTEGSDVVTSVSFGDIVEDTSAKWFFSGLTTEGSDVVTNVTVGAVTFTADNNSSFASSAIVSASVSNHVLTFSTGSFMTPVAISQADSVVDMSGFSKGGVKLSGASFTSKGFTTASLSQAETSVSFKSVLFDDVTLSQTSASYFFDKAQDHNYEAVIGYTKVTVTDADVIKNGAVIENPTITASIPANSVAVDVTGGTLPTFSVGAATGTISGTVGTALTTSSVSWLGVDPSKKDIAVAGAYTLVSDSTVTGAIKVAAANTYDLNNGAVTITAGAYVTDVLVDGTSIGKVEPEQ